MRAALRRLTRAVGVVAVLVLAAGCTAIPAAGPVEVGLEDLTEVEGTGQLQYNPLSPVAGASKEDLVRGFLLAATSSADDYTVAREFLTNDYAGQWDPDDGVLIDSGGSRPYRADGDTAGVLSIGATAKVDAEGFMLPVEPGPRTDLRFEFERVDDEWRISSAPSGIILDSSTFSTIWSSRQIYFVGQGGFLVPETRWFLNRTAVTTEIVGALLEGPGQQLRDVVHSGFPSGTALVSSSVPVVDGVARIDLTSPILQASPDALAELQQQLKYSLQSVAGISGFDLFADGAPIRDIPADAENTPQLANETGPPAVLRDGQFGTLLSGEFSELTDLSGPVADLDPLALTLSPDEHAVAALTADGVIRVDAQGSAPVDVRPDQLPPSFDAFDYIWTTQTTAAGTLRATGADGVAHQVAAPWLAGRQPAAVRVSPEGSRIAALVRDEDQSLVLIAGIVRDADGVPTGTTTEAEVQLWTNGAPVDLDWVGQLHFAVLSRTEAGNKATLGGPGLLAVAEGAVPGGQQIAGNGSRTQLRVLGEQGNLFSSQGSGWQASAEDIAVLGKRG